MNLDLDLFEFDLSADEWPTFQEWVNAHQGMMPYHVEHVAKVYVRGSIANAEQRHIGAVIFANPTEAIMFKLRWHQVLRRKGDI